MLSFLKAGWMSSLVVFSNWEIGKGTFALTKGKCQWFQIWKPVVIPWNPMWSLCEIVWFWWKLTPIFQGSPFVNCYHRDFLENVTIQDNTGIGGNKKMFPHSSHLWDTHAMWCLKWVSKCRFSTHAHLTTGPQVYLWGWCLVNVGEQYSKKKLAQLSVHSK